jgi:hypothetical protein
MGVPSPASRKFAAAPGKSSENPKWPENPWTQPDPSRRSAPKPAPVLEFSETVTDVANPMSRLAKSPSSILPGRDPVSMFGINSEL